MDTNRIFGLDLMRATAILLVVRSHADDLLEPFWSADTGVPDIDGVDLFFVLSGFLIGGILLRVMEAVHIPWHRRLLDFWQRRWLRTLPNYFLFLGINVVLVHEDLIPGVLNTNTLAYIVFLQNFIVPVDLFFWESWSLAVEEWFYVLLPLVLFTCATARIGAKWSFILAIGSMVLVPAILRSQAMDAIGTPIELDRSIRRVVVMRMDTIGFGVLAAWVGHYFPALWRKRQAELLVLGAIGFVTATLLRGPDGLVYMGTWYFTLSAISMTLWLPVLSSWVRTGRWGGPIGFLSRISYALYLVHLPVRYLIEGAIPDASPSGTVLVYVGYWAICILLSAAIHHFFERRFMGMRNGISRRILDPRALTPSS
ncbi:MAG: acyltransferase [Flavobacteriales bacterium]|nr:acyltransferase [Flavobacteriales bacterium]